MHVSPGSRGGRSARALARSPLLARDELTPQMFGAVGNGVTDDSDALRAMFAEAMRTGERVKVRAGTYLMTKTVSATLTASLDVECDVGAVFIGAASFAVDTKMFFFQALAGSVSFRWRGGRIDGSLRPARSSGAPDLMYVVCTEDHLSFAEVVGVDFYSNEDRSGTAGDSCLFLVAEDCNVSFNRFRGGIDAGLYLSASGADTLPRRATIIGNKCIECGTGITTKRQFELHTILGNVAEDCSFGIIVGGEADGDLPLPGRKASVVGNTIVRALRAIEVRIADGTVVTGNYVEDYGIDSAGTPIAETGILVSGSSGVTVSGNSVIITGAFTPHVSSNGIGLSQRTFDEVTYTSDDCLVSGNNVGGAARAIVEGTGVDNNTIIGNATPGATTAAVIVGAGTVYIAPAAIARKDVAQSFTAVQTFVEKAALPKGFAIGAGVNHTIDGGAITLATAGLLNVDTEAAAAADDLVTINGGDAGDLIVIKTITGARDVTLKDATGNLILAGDCVLGASTDRITLMKFTTNWVELCRSLNG